MIIPGGRTVLDQGPTRVICLGSYQGGDRVAWRLAEALRAMPECARAFDIVECAAPAYMPNLCAGATKLVIIDAVLGLAPGTVRQLSEADLAATPACSSHGVNLITALGVARALGDLPANTVILGIGLDDSAPDSAVSRCSATLLSALRRFAEGP